MEEGNKNNRNFRSAFIFRIGCRGVEERKSIEILKQEKPLNLMKLKQFCLRFNCPGDHRSFLWKILLGIAPVYSDSTNNIMTQRQIVYDDLLHTLTIMKIVTKDKPKSRIFYAMWLLENKKLYLGRNIYEEESVFVNIAACLLRTFENDVELYWLTKGFYSCTEKIAEEMPKLIELTQSLLEKEDPAIYNHLKNINILNQLPYNKWYVNCFSGVLIEVALIRIWDKICGGSVKILIFVFIVILIKMRDVILKNTNMDVILKSINNIKNEDELGDSIVNKAIELWLQKDNHKL